jgi:hypothetical protein
MKNSTPKRAEISRLNGVLGDPRSDLGFGCLPLGYFLDRDFLGVTETSLPNGAHYTSIESTAPQMPFWGATRRITCGAVCYH